MTAPALPLGGDALADLGRQFEGYARGLDADATRGRLAWSAARSEGLAGTAFDAAEAYLSDLLTGWSERAALARRAAAILAATSVAQRALEELFALLGALGDEQPAVQVALQQVRGLGDALDQVCAAELAEVCGVPTLTPERSLSDFAGRPVAEIDAYQRSTAPPEALEALAEYPDAQVLEAGAGGLVVAFGDIDSAPTVITSVPGVHSADPAGWAGQLARGRVLQQATGGAAVMWLGYAAPNQVALGARLDPARQGGADLRRFQEALHQRARDRGAVQRLTVLGHSYGTVVVGQAARPGSAGLRADAIVLSGSPGVGVNHAGELVLHPTRQEAPQVHAVTGRADPIGLVGTSKSGPHGVDPSSAAFGANRWPSGADHTSYWDDPDFLRRTGEVARGETS